jgi:hypothetical protein
MKAGQRSDLVFNFVRDAFDIRDSVGQFAFRRPGKLSCTQAKRKEELAN